MMEAESTAGSYLWMELEIQTSTNTRKLRGKSLFDVYQKLIEGENLVFVKLEECYWCNHESGEHNTRVRYQCLGEGHYTNFTGEVYVKVASIVSIAILHGGYTTERTNNPRNEEDQNAILPVYLNRYLLNKYK